MMHNCAQPLGADFILLEMLPNRRWESIYIDRWSAFTLQLTVSCFQVLSTAGQFQACGYDNMSTL